MKSLLPAVVAVALLAASHAQANVYIGLQEAGVNGGALTEVASGATFASWSGAYGPWFNIHNISVTSLGAELASTALDVLGTAARKLIVKVTSTDQTGDSPFLSSLTSNLLPAGGSVTLSTFADAGDGIFATTTPLASHDFATIGTDVSTDPAVVSGFHSITGVYEINSPGGGLSPFLDTIRVTAAVPEPSHMGLLMGALLVGAGLMVGRRSAS